MTYPTWKSIGHGRVESEEVRDGVPDVVLERVTDDDGMTAWAGAIRTSPGRYLFETLPDAKRYFERAFGRGPKRPTSLRLARAYAAGLTLQGVANAHGVAMITVQRALKAHGVPARRPGPRT